MVLKGRREYEKEIEREAVGALKVVGRSFRLNVPSARVIHLPTTGAGAGRPLFFGTFLLPPYNYYGGGRDFRLHYLETS